MQDSLHLLKTRRFLPLFATQFLGAFNDNLFRTSMVMLVIYGIYRDAEQEAAFSAIAGGLFILPFFLLSALAGQLADAHDKARIIRIVKTAEIGRIVGGMVPPALPADEPEIPGYPRRGMDWHILRASITLVSGTLHIPRLFLAILSISFFWAMGAVLAAQFPPLVKNVLGADQSVATLFLAVFSVGVAIGSVAINRLLAGKVAAKFAPVSALMMGVFVLLLYWLSYNWERTPELVGIGTFLSYPLGWAVVLDLFGVAVAGGMFVVPLYAFLTTTVPKSETARTVAANNIVNAGAMVAATLILAALIFIGVSVAETLFLVAVASIIAAWLGYRLHRACD